MKLQVALDGELESSLRVLEEVAPYVDIAEIGTPLVLRHGMKAVREVRRAFPLLAILADFKIMDAGELEAAIAFEAGCDWVTVLGAAHPTTVRGAVKAGARFGKRVMVDMLQVSNLQETTRESLEMGCHAILLHTAYDLRETRQAPFADLTRLRAGFPGAPLAIAGGITLDMAAELRALQPAIVVVGSAIAEANDPAEVARRFRQQLPHDN